MNLPQIDSEVVAKEIEDFIIEETLAANATGGVVGLSGGIDSTTVAYLAKNAYDRLNAQIGEEKYSLYGLLMPAKANTSEDAKDGYRVAETLNIEYKLVNIQPTLDILTESNDTFEDPYDAGNAAARVRMINLYGEARKQNKLVLGTGNKDEDFHLGYFTKFGDGGVDLSPIGSLSKRLVRQLASYLGVPDDLVNRVSTAALWEGQTDEGELGFTYDQAEKVMTGYLQGFNTQEIFEETEIDKNTVEKIILQHERNQHKLHMPKIANVTFKEEKE